MKDFIMKQKHLLEFSCDLRFVIHQTVDVLLDFFMGKQRNLIFF